jgi:hypothetical protein
VAGCVGVAAVPSAVAVDSAAEVVEDEAVVAVPAGTGVAGAEVPVPVSAEVIVPAAAVPGGVAVVVSEQLPETAEQPHASRPRFLGASGRLFD